MQNDDQNNQIDNPKTFKDPTRLTNWLRGTWYTYIAGMSTLVCLSLLVLVCWMYMRQGGEFAQDSKIADLANLCIDNEFLFFTLLGLFSWIPALLLLTWIHRANYNARHLGSRGMRFSPGWSVGWFFIPVLNIWKPYQVLKELWKTSIDPQYWKSQKGPSILPWLWVLIFTSPLFYAAGSITTNLAETLDGVIIGGWIKLIGYLMMLASPILILTLIKSIYSRQMMHFAQGARETEPEEEPQYTFKNPTRLTRWLTFFLYANIALCVLTALTLLLELDLLTNIQK